MNCSMEHNIQLLALISSTKTLKTVYVLSLAPMAWDIVPSHKTEIHSALEIRFSNK
jgi:hypothetical protein